MIASLQASSKRTNNQCMQPFNKVLKTTEKKKNLLTYQGLLDLMTTKKFDYNELLKINAKLEQEPQTLFHLFKLADHMTTE